jgi:hypothetical protein
VDDKPLIKADSAAAWPKALTIDVTKKPKVARRRNSFFTGGHLRGLQAYFTADRWSNCHFTSWTEPSERFIGHSLGLF